MITWIVEKERYSARVYEKGQSDKSNKLLYNIGNSGFSTNSVKWTDTEGNEVVRFTYPSFWDYIRGKGQIKIEMGGSSYAHIETDVEYQSMPALIPGDGSKYRIVTPTDVLFSPNDYPTDLWKSGQFIGKRVLLSKDSILYQFEFTTENERDILNFVLLDYLVCPAAFPD